MYPTYSATGSESTTHAEVERRRSPSEIWHSQWANAQSTFGYVIRSVCEAVVRGLRVLGRILACLVAGIGTGMVTVGAFALREPQVWEMRSIQEVGPPLGPVLLGIGVACLTTEVLLIILFFRPWSKRGTPV